MNTKASTSDNPQGLAPNDFRLPAESHPGRVRLQVADLDRSIAYYGNVVGLREHQRTNGHAVLGDGVTPLVVLEENRGAQHLGRHSRLGLYHFALLLPHRLALARFVRHLAIEGVGFGQADHLVSEAIYLTDPDGLGIEVYADRARSEWRIEDGQIAMATDPLRVQDLLSLARDEPWSGVPEGTRMGHVHLHVGDIEDGARFYHAALGFDKTVWTYPGALFLSAGGYHHHLGTNTWAAGAPPAADGEARLLDWVLVVPTDADAEATARSVESAGYPVEQIGAAWLTADPWGTALRIESEDKSL
jgi:catechol 2,3-dioxygenase